MSPPYREARVQLDGIIVRQPWRAAGSGLQLGVCIAFEVLVVYAAARPFTPKLAFAPYRVLMLLTALGLGWFLLTWLVNSTTLSIERGTLVVQHGPISSMGFGPPAARIPVSQIAAIETRVLDGVFARLRDGSDVLLVKTLSTVEQTIATEVADAVGVSVARYR